MKHSVTPISSSNGSPRRRRTARSLDLFATVPDGRTAAAMDDAEEAERLIDDLLALVEAGLVEPIRHDGQIRYAPADPDDLTA
jgi:hypothetical protein